MKLKVKAVGVAPDYYEVDATNKTITVYDDGKSDTFDFSEVPDDAGKIQVDEFNGKRPIRSVEMIDGELHIAICQRVGFGNWSGSDWFDASEYDPYKRYVEFDNAKSFVGVATYWTKAGEQALGE